LPQNISPDDKSPSLARGAFLWGRITAKEP
jgi:hypothetical protein